MQKKFLTASLLLVPFALQAFTQDRVQDRAQDKAKPAASAEIATVGKPAPMFKLNDHTGKGVKVGGPSKTWTVLAFYPRAMTRG